MHRLGEGILLTWRTNIPSLTGLILLIGITWGKLWKEREAMGRSLLLVNLIKAIFAKLNQMTNYTISINVGHLGGEEEEV